jgi:two-component system, response regulator FlrC
MKQYDVLIVEDDLALCEALCETLEIEGYRVAFANNGSEALQKLEQNRFNLVVSDVKMPSMDGMQLLRAMQNKFKDTPVLLMTAFGTISKAVEAMQFGAVDYLIKPFEAKTLVSKVADYVAGGAQETMRSIYKPVVQDKIMKDLYELVYRVAKTDATVLLQGESGTGKEVMARYIHQNSNYHDGPFVAVNCAAIPETMLEAMLFGYEKGAFTGSVQSMPGKFEQAQEGTLLLDEISEMELGLQAKLLRVLQEKEVERLGSQKKIKLNVRILAASNQKLKEKLAQGRFREDLYYRLNVFPIRIPSLRERPGDILPLAQELVQRHCTEGKKLPHFDILAIKKMLDYHWPGNVRELENLVQRALILRAEYTITSEDLVFEEFSEQGFGKMDNSATEAEIGAGSKQDKFEFSGLDEGVRCAEENIILQTLQIENGSRKTTAEKLGISPRTLRYKMARMKEAGIVLPC